MLLRVFAFGKFVRLGRSPGLARGAGFFLFALGCLGFDDAKVGLLFLNVHRLDLHFQLVARLSSPLIYVGFAEGQGRQVLGDAIECGSMTTR